MSEEEQEIREGKYPCCSSEEYKAYFDDCGSVGCRLLKTKWNEWMGEDNCEDCPYACEEDSF